MRNRAAVAVMKAAYDVANESAGTTNHAKRLLWANYALLNPLDEAARIMWGLLSNATIATSGESSTDGDIQFVINSLVDTMANRF